MTLTSPCSSAPVTLLPVIYRLWARLRLRRVEAWRAAWDPALADAPKGADGQAWGLAWDLAVAPATGAVVAGIATDLSKCYDGVRLPLLRRLLAAAGWPAGLVAPLLAAYSAPRRLRVGDALGAFVSPAAGLPAGCPLAVSVLAVLTWPWQVAVAATGATRARRYVDDLTAWARGPLPVAAQAAAAAWVATEAFVAPSQLTIQLAKSGVFSGTRRGPVSYTHLTLPTNREV